MDVSIIIDDDFTLDVVEEEDEEFWNKDTFENAIQSECDLWKNTEYVNDVNIKEELEIDCEYNYLIEDKFVNLTEIKTEIDSDTECDETAHDESPTESESSAQVDETVKYNATVATPSNSVPKKSSNGVSDIAEEETEPITQNNVILEESHHSTSTNLILHKEPAPQTQNQEKCTTVEAKTQNSLSKPSHAPLDRRKNYINMKSTRQRNKKSKRRRKHLKRLRKLSSPKSHRNHVPNRNDSFLSKPFTKKLQPNSGGRNIWRNTTCPNADIFQNPVNSTQTGPVNWQTYSTILSALNQLLGNNQNLQCSDNVVPVHQKNQFCKSKARVQLRDRPQVWANEYQTKAPSLDSATPLQMYTNILSAVAQLNNRAVMQRCPSYTSLNRVELQMSSLNVFGSL